MSEALHELLPPLLRALWAGHPSHRGRVIRALERADDATLSAEPVAPVFRRLLAGESVELCKHVGELVGRRRLSAYAPDLTGLLREGDAERRGLAEEWLRRLPRPLPALIALATDERVGTDARRAGLRLLERQPLDVEDRGELVAALAEDALHEGVLAALGDAVDEALVEQAILQNAAFGERLRARAGVRERGLWAWLAPARPSSLGVWPNLAAQQRGFLLGIARLAARARSRRWLAALVEHLHTEGFQELLEHAYVELEMREVAGALLERLQPHATEPVKARVVRLLGRLRHEAAAPRLKPLLPPHGRAPSEVERAAVLALARLGDAAAIAAHLAGVAAALRRALGEPPAGTPAHQALWRTGLSAAAELGERGPELAEWRRLSLALLVHPRCPDELADELPRALVRLAPLELVPTVRGVLRDPQAPSRALTQAIEVVRRAGQRELLGELVELARRSRAHTDACADVLARLSTAEDVGRVRALLVEAGPSDAPARRLLRCLEDLALPDDVEAAATEMLTRGRGGRRAQEAALRYLGAHQAPGAFLRTCVGLVRAGGPARARALREALRRGLLRPDEASRHVAEGATLDLLELACDSLVRHDQDEDAKRVVNALLQELLPLEEPGGALGPDEARELRRRLRTLGHWTEAATFHAMHRELLEVARLARETGEGRPDVGLLHGALLLRLARHTFRHPVSGARQRYWGPLPRFEETFAHPSRFVQEALFDVVASPAYLCTDGLLVRFFASPRPRVRAAALGRTSREGVLVHEEAALALARDPDPAARRALVARLRELELGRFAATLRPLLEDPDEGARLAATRTLAEWGDASCLQPLTAFLASEDGALRREATEVLRRFDPARLVGVLAPSVSLEAPRAAAAALAALRPDRLPPDEALGDAIFAVAARGQGPLRARALRFLPALADARRLGEVVPLLEDGHPEVRAAAAAVLRRRDGRRFAGAIAACAGRARRSDVRLEALALLADLGVPEAAPGLVPLLADDDPDVRRATRAAVLAARGYSLAPDLEALLRAALDGSLAAGTGGGGAEQAPSGASPEAIAELVALLDRVGDAELSEPFVLALRCEDRRVWEAAFAAARLREPAGRPLLERLADLLAAEPPLPAPLLGLGLRELERRDARAHPRLRRAVQRLAAEAAAPAVRRKATALLVAWGDEQAEARAKELAEVSLAEVRALEKERQQKGARDVRRELVRARAGLTTGERLRLRLAAARGASAWRDAARGASAWRDAARALPQEVGRKGVVAGDVLVGVARRWSEDAGFDAQGALKALPEAQRGLHPLAAEAALLRDQLAPEEWLRRFEREQRHVPQRDRVHALLWTGAAPDVEAWIGGLDRQDYRYEQEEDHLLACMEHWRPSLREAFPRLVTSAKRFADGIPDDRWGGKARRLQTLCERYARVKLRLGIAAETPELGALATDDDFAARLLAAEDRGAALGARLETLAGIKTAPARAHLATLLGEVGDEAAAALLAKLADDADANVRQAAGQALAQLRPAAAPAARGAVLSLLQAKEVPVRAAGFAALAALGERLPDRAELEGHVLRQLTEGRSSWSAAPEAACRAAVALGLVAAVPALAKLPERADAVEALCRLAREEDAELLLDLFLEASLGAKQQRAVGAVLARVLPAARVDRLSLGLSKTDRIVSTLEVLRARGGGAPPAAVVDLLGHPLREIREAACAAAAQLEDPETLSALEARLALQSETAEVRAAALRALAQRKARADRAAARAWLLERGGSQQRWERTACLEALAELLGDEPPDHELAGWALEKLRDAIAPGLALPEAHERADGATLAERLAAHRPGAHDGPQAKAAVRSLLRAPEERARAEELLWWAARHPELRQAAWPALRLVLREVGEASRADRLYAVARAGERGAEAFFDALIRCAPARAAAHALSLDLRWAKPAEKRRVARALAAAVQAGEERYAGELRERLLDPDHGLRWLARTGLDPTRAPRAEQEEDAA
ncbi:MAG: HEAT repeat domain-containing protein [Planctomycetota bacterium]